MNRRWGAMVQGDLSDGTSLADLLQYLVGLGKPGQLMLERTQPRTAAALHLAEGRIVHAECPPLVGDDAVFALLRWRAGRFAFLPGASADRITVTADVPHLLLESARRDDELARLHARLPGANQVLHQVHGRTHATLTHDQWRLFTLVDGLRPVAELLRLADPDALLAAQDLVALVDQELVRTRPDDDFLATVMLTARAVHRADHPDLTVLDLRALPLMDGSRSLAAIQTDLATTGQAMVDSARRLVALGLARVTRGDDLFHHRIR
jgi:hypothetical protein